MNETSVVKPDRILSPDQIAEREDVSAEAVRDWLTVGVVVGSDDGTRRRIYLPARKVGGRWKVKESDFNAFVEQITEASLPPSARKLPVSLRPPAETEAERRRRGKAATERVLKRLRGE